MPANSIDVVPMCTGVEDASSGIIANNVSSLISQQAESLWRREFADQVVVAGMSARLPQSDNIMEFKEHLMHNEDMVTESDRSWTPGLYNTPLRSGKLKDLSKFDSMFFGISHKQAHRMDPQMRMLLEVVYESIIDAGIDPQSLRGTKTGVFIGASDSEAASAWSADAKTTSGLTLIGCQRGMFANRLSYFFDFRGPSFTVDTACSSSLLAMDLALTALRTGQCEQAIVGGSNITIRLATSVQFAKLGMLSSKGMCKSFDESGDGYCRSEGIVAILLQKSAAALRIYATLLHSKTNCDGAKDGSQAITFPSGMSQKQLMQEVYAEASINPAQVKYVEAHGTGTKAGDPEELQAITDIFCKNRTGPLLIGSTKSNMGHPEPASGLAALVKVLIAMEEKVIPANLHYSEPNCSIPGLLDGRLKVVSSNTPWQGGLVAMNSFGFGGANVHAVLESHRKIKEGGQLGLTCKLLLYGGRTESGLRRALQQAATHAGDAEFGALLNRSAYSSTKSVPYRGYVTTNAANKAIEVKKCSSEKRPIWYVFAGMGTQWDGMGRDLMQLTSFRESIMRSDAVLRPLGVNVTSLIMKEDGREEFSSTVYSFVGIAAIQVALVDTLSVLGIQPNGIVGHSVGELGCAYADGSLTAKEAVLAAYWRGKCIMDACLEPGAMAAVGLSWDEARRRCPSGVVPACHNSLDTVTISGPRDSVTNFVEQLKAEGVFAKEVQSNGVAFHSYYMAAIASKLKEALAKVIVPKERSQRWVSTSLAEAEWNSSLAKMSSAEYHVNNLVSPVLFQEGISQIPADAVVIEIAPHCLLQAILKRSLSKNCENIGLQKRDQKNNLEYFLNCVGKLYISGCDPRITNLYPAVTFPVSSGTPMISSLIDWDHSDTFDVPGEKEFNLLSQQSESECSRTFTFDVTAESDDHYLLGHKIDGRILFPATGYLVLAWKLLAASKGQCYETMPVLFEDVSILSATMLPHEGTISFDVHLLPVTGEFEISHSGGVVATGKVLTVDKDEDILVRSHRAAVLTPDTAGSVRNGYLSGLGTPAALSPADIYKELRLRGYEYGPSFQGIHSSSMTGSSGQLSWNGNWVTFLDCMLQMTILGAMGQGGLRLPTRIRNVRISPAVHQLQLVDNAAEQNAFTVTATVDECVGLIEAGGVQIFGLHTTSASHRKDLVQPTLESYDFVPFVHTANAPDDMPLSDYLSHCSYHAHQLLRAQGAASSINFTETSSDSIDLNQSEELAKLPGSELLRAILAMAPAADGGRDSKATSFKECGPFDCTKDMLLQQVMRNACLKPLLDLALENGAGRRHGVAVVELQAQRWHLHEHVIPLLTSQPLVNVEYVAVEDQAANSGTIRAAHDPSSDPVTFASWHHEQPPADKLKWADLVVLRCDTSMESECCIVSSVAALLKDNGFLLLLAPTSDHHIQTVLETTVDASVNCWTDSDWIHYVESQGYRVLARVSDGFMATAFLFRLHRDELRPIPGLSVILHMNDLCPSWFDALREKFVELQSYSGPDLHQRRLWLVANECSHSGIVGLVNCLRQEPGGALLRCAFNASLDRSSTSLLTDSQLFKSIQEKDLVVNVYRNNEWGSFRHQPLDRVRNRVNTDFAYVNVTEKGSGLSHLQWIESPLKYFQPCPNKELCAVSYASLNFRDVMLATGKLPPDAIPGHMQLQDCLLGMEFSGHNKTSGTRVMGLLAAKGLATQVDADPRFLWPVPSSWSLEEAATVPVVYATAYYALVVRARIRRGQSVLIHSGSGGVGQAAISVALHYGCDVYTSVGSADKKLFLQKRFPQLSDKNFCNSRDTSFEFDLKRRTAGKGMDVILNSLSDEKLQASLRVLAPHGVFLEIGKFDLANNSLLGMGIFLKNVTFHGILLDALFEDGNTDWSEVRDLVTTGLDMGVVRPLPTTVYGYDHVEDAFRYMAQGKHIGKVLVKVCNQQSSNSSTCFVSPTSVKAIPKVYCHPDKVYIITGGLGGFGLELGDWLIRRGCRKLVLTSRSGVTSGYQARCLQKWYAEHGVTTVISRKNVGDKQDAEQLLLEAAQIGSLGGIFHLAMVLRDGFVENLTTVNFEKVCAPKVYGTLNLDQLTRTSHGKDVELFVVFSSISGGRGNAGQSSYGFANTAMERICEQRVRDGFPGVAVQWGAIGDVGVVANTMGGNDTVVGGTLPQRIASCLDMLDVLLRQPSAVVSCFVRSASESAAGSTDGANSSTGSRKDLPTAIAHILGIADVSSVPQDASLGDLGLDSLMGVEVKQVLEQDFDVVLPMKAIRALTLVKLQELSTKAQSMTVTSAAVTLSAPTSSPDHMRSVKAAVKLMPDVCLLRFKSTELTNSDSLHKEESSVAQQPVFFVHPIEGVTTCLQEVAAKLTCSAYGIQCVSSCPLDSIEKLAAYYIKVMQESGFHQDAALPFRLVGYSFGAAVAFEMARQLEAAGGSAQVVLLDGSHAYVAAHTAMYKAAFTPMPEDGKSVHVNAEAEVEALCAFLLQVTSINYQKVRQELTSQADFVSRIDYVARQLSQEGYAADDVKLAAQSFYSKLLAADTYAPPPAAYRGDITLIKSSASELSQRLGVDYCLGHVCTGHVSVHTVEGNHKTFLQQSGAASVANLIESVFGKLA